MQPHVIETENLTKIFGHKLIAVNNVNLKVEEGAIFGFLGPNGSGKTTAIRLLLGLIKPSAGEVRVFGEKMSFNSSNLRKRIGYLPTNPKFPPKMTPIQYLDFIGRLFGLSKDERMGRLSRLLRAAGLLSSASREIKSFSTGMVTRLGMAAALMNDPDLLILDEPTSGLDPAGRKSTLELIEELGKEKTVFVSSHVLSDIDKITTHVGVIHEGKTIFSGSIKEMKKYTQSNMVRLELDGNLDLFCENLKTVEGIIGFERRGDFGLDVSFDVTLPMLEVIKKIVGLVSKYSLDLISITSSTSSIEEAFLKILEEEESHGFLRAV
ncbi:MAG: ABC transporter ATP-binding protein [Nitrososphaerales archaeon]